jgi:hypothetical protein
MPKGEAASEPVLFLVLLPYCGQPPPPPPPSPPKAICLKPMRFNRSIMSSHLCLDTIHFVGRDATKPSLRLETVFYKSFSRLLTWTIHQKHHLLQSYLQKLIYRYNYGQKPLILCIFLSQIHCQSSMPTSQNQCISHYYHTKP